MLAASATTTASVDRKYNRPLLLQGRRHKMTEEVVLLEVDIKKRADVTSKETVRIRRVIIDISPHVKTTNLNRDANSAIIAHSRKLRLTVSQAKDEEKCWKRICCQIEEFEAFWAQMCVARPAWRGGLGANPGG